jgi:apolipoprotein D and lipocalin family protein
MKLSRGILFLMAAFSLTGCRTTSDLEVVTGFDLDQYLGKWYEAARYPHRFEKDLVSVTADYSLNSDGTVKVLNRGYNPGTGLWEEVEGVAKMKSDPSAGWLKVSFFKPFYASYKILHLDEDYTEAIITGPTYNYLWILVREKDLSEKDLDRLIAKADGFGFDTQRLQIIDHSIQEEQ